MTIQQDKRVIIFLEEQNEDRGLTHLVSEEAFRYPKPYDGDLYVAGYDINGNLHFLLVEMKNEKETIVHLIEDEELFNKLLDYYHNPNRLPETEADEKLRRTMGLDASSEQGKRICQMAKLPISRL